ncbi:MAG: methylmalonyl-CoA mutase [Candidatus Dadabacteria bacterium]|nr:MAG: methylmalonyl-CoA mutase [Candidatus Dadabacteria bacterium]
MTERKKFKTASGILLKEYYSDSDLLEDFSLEAPGEYPYTRGVYKTMYRGRLWTMRQYAGYADAKESNKRFRYLLSQGSTGISIAFDLPTQLGRDPDDRAVEGEVGKVGVSIASIEDMRELLDGIPLSEVSVSMTINATAPILLAMLLVVAEEQGVSWKEVRGTVQNDILKEYIARGNYIFPPKEALRLVTDIFEFCSKEVPKFNTISVSGYHIREAGSTAVQELAFTLANGITYVESAIKRGLKPDDFLPRVAFFFNAHSDFLEEIAKFRAARRLWAKITKERFNAQHPRSSMLRFHTQTAGSSLTAQQPMCNIIRTTLQALSAVLGGTQSLHTNAYDEALGLPTEESALLALRTQQVIAYESGVPSVVDPLGGSYTIEALTRRIEEEVLKLISEVDKLGGMLTAIEKEFPQKEIEKSAYQYQKEVEEGKRIVIGVNKFHTKEKSSYTPLKISLEKEKARKEEVVRFKERRDKKKVSRALKALEEAAKDESKNLMPLIIEGVKAGCTVGEQCEVLAKVFGRA